MGTNNKKQMAGLFRRSNFFHPQGGFFIRCLLLFKIASHWLCFSGNASDCPTFLSGICYSVP